jgi:hypothetical protein
MADPMTSTFWHRAGKASHPVLQQSRYEETQREPDGEHQPFLDSIRKETFVGITAHDDDRPPLTRIEQEVRGWVKSIWP